MEIPNYLHFIATFEDGSQIFQNERDESETTPGKNCYFDVLERQQRTPLVCFVLRNNDRWYGVDLRDGHFEIDRVPFFQHEQPLKDFTLVYFRNVQIHRTVSVGSNAAPPVDTAELNYILGWEAFYKGESIKRIIKTV